MKRVISNDSLVPTIVLGHLLQPGQSRDVDVPDELVSAIPEGSPPAVNAPAQSSPEGDHAGHGKPDWPGKLLALQALSVAKLKPELDGLVADELQTLAQIEEAAEQPRSSVLELLAAAQLKLARAAGGGDPT